MPSPLALTLGEPAVSGLTSPSPPGAAARSSSLAPFYVLADPEFLARRAERIAPGVPIAVVEPQAPAPPSRPRCPWSISA